MSRINGILLVFLFAGFGMSCSKTSELVYKYNYLYEELPFEMDYVQGPTIPDYQRSIVDFGGVGDGQFNNAQVFNKAVSQISEKGGGTLVVPSGIWLTGPIVFKSRINLYLEKGALLLFSSNYDDYPLVKAVFEGLETRRCQSPISGTNLTDIAITGSGTIDGAGFA